MALPQLTAAGAEALSAGLGFLGNLGGSVSGGLFGANQARKNRKFQERMYYQQVKDNLDFWNRQNAYNLPSAQVQRLRDANLSPMLMYGEGGISGNIAQAPQTAQAPHGAQASANSFNTRLDMANLALVEAQAKALEAQAHRDESQSDLTKSQTEGQDIFNWINDKTRSIQIALKYGDYDFVRQQIRESQNRIFQSSFVNAHEMAALTLQNSLAIRKMNLSEYEVGNNVLQGWEMVKTGRIQANAAARSAYAQLLDATTAARLAPYQIGVMRATASKLTEEYEFLKGSRSYRIDQEYNISRLQRKEISWYDIVKESDLSDQQSRIFLNEANKINLYNQVEARDMDTYLWKPTNMLLNFGAGAVVGGAFGSGVKPMGKIGFK